MNPIDHARRGDADYFKGVALDVLMNTRDERGDSLLSIAVLNHHFDCCVEIFNRCPSLLYTQSSDQYTVMHQAAYTGRPKFVKFLISAAQKSFSGNEQDVESGGENMPNNKKLFRMLDRWGATPLWRAVQRQHVKAVKMLVEADPEFFQFDGKNGRENPFSLRLRQASADHSSGKMRKLLLELQPGLSKYRIGQNGWTLLHDASFKGDMNAIEDILWFSPDCGELVDNAGRNFLHLAAKYEHIKVVKYVLGTRDMAASLVNEKDKDGNTPLHLAALSGNESLTLCFLYDPRVNKMTMNNNGQLVLDAIHFAYDRRKAGVHGVQLDREGLKDQSDFDLVVGALIATVSFTAGITVPGGYISGGGADEGMAVLVKKVSFEIFVMSNILALTLSLYAVFSHFCARRLVRNSDLIYQLKVAAFCTIASIFAMMVAFISGSYTVLANSKRLAITAAACCCSFFIFAFRAMWRMIKQPKKSAHFME